MENSENANQGLPPSVALVQMLSGKWISQAISTAAKLRIADHLSDGQLGLGALAVKTDTKPRALLGLMRALTSVGIFVETDDTHFANTPLSEPLREGLPGSARALALFIGDRPSWDAWGELAYSIRTGKSAFRHVHGELPYEYFGKRKEECAYYDEAFTNFSNQEMDAVLRAVSFSEVETFVDVGGGHGTMLCGSLRLNPKQKGVLFDQPHIIDGARPVIESFGVRERCEVMGGDFFKSVPAGADGYLIKHVLFNWNDERAEDILKTVRKATPPHARVYIIDPVIRPGQGQVFAKFMDLEMGVLHDGGCQRTETEFSWLLSRSGFRIVRVVDTAAPSSVIEAVPV